MALTLFNTFAATSIFDSQWQLAAAHIATPMIPDCIPPGCIDIIEDQLHPREKMLLEGFATSSYEGLSFYERYFGRNEESEKLLGSPEYLRFRQDDPKDKFLFLSAEESHNDALNPKYKVQLLKDINEKYDLKFKVFKSFDEMCDQIDQASKVGKLTNVVINAHGYNEGMHISGDIEDANNWLHKNRDYSKCFEAMDLSGKITLLGCMTGAPKDGDLKDNIAQKIATSAKRLVVAPINMTFASKTKMARVENFEVFQENIPHKSKDSHQKWWDIFNLFSSQTHSSKNIFKVFHPIYDSCVKVFKDKIHAREQAAIDVVKKATDSKSTLIQPEEFDDLQDLLRLCKDDPRQKFLYLSMEADHNGALNPENNPELFASLAKNYDFKFKVVKTYNELCQEIQEAAKMDHFTNIILNGHGNPEGIHIADKNIWDNYLHKYRDLNKCFDGSGLSKVTLFSCNVAAPKDGDLNNNIANDLAKAAKIKVLAPGELFYLSLAKITSLNPLEIYHPSECDKYDNCKSDVNTFQNIEQKKKS